MLAARKHGETAELAERSAESGVEWQGGAESVGSEGGAFRAEPALFGSARAVADSVRQAWEQAKTTAMAWEERTAEMNGEEASRTTEWMIWIAAAA
ncbi:unnamed protein product [Closterium sp. NIES-53]